MTRWVGCTWVREYQLPRAADGDGGVMADYMLDEDWLKGINEQFRAEGVAPGQRPWLAIRDLAVKSEIAVAFPSPEAELIFRWFEVHAPSEMSRIGSLLSAAYYFDARFWPLEIPVFFGTCRLEPMRSLRGMPENLKQEIVSSASLLSTFVHFWLECLDYACGYSEISKGQRSFGTELFSGAGAELRSAVSQLGERNPNPRATLSSRMATELYLKAFIAMKTGLTEKDAKGLGHDLNASLNRCFEVSPSIELEFLRVGAQRFPEIRDRYDDYQPHSRELWECYSMAQRAGTAVVRAITRQDSRDRR
jgi:hypothetical protein